VRKKRIHTEKQAVGQEKGAQKESIVEFSQRELVCRDSPTQMKSMLQDGRIQKRGGIEAGTNRQERASKQGQRGGTPWHKSKEFGTWEKFGMGRVGGGQSK